MRRLLILLCLACIGCGSGDPDGRWETVELGTDAEFRDIFFLDAQQGWMVGAVGVDVPGGILAHTTDGGQTWRYQTGLVPKRSRTHSVDLNAVHFVDASRGCIAAESGTILITEDGGATWRKVPPTGPVYAHHRDIDFVDEQNGWIVGRRGVLHTEDGGTSWTRIDEDLEPTGNSIDFLDHSRGWVVGKHGNVHRTDDGGVTWDKVAALGDLEGLQGDDIPTLMTVHFADAEHGWIAGYRRELTLAEQHDHAVIIHTSDGGETWQHQLQEVEALLTSIRFVDARRGWAVGYNVNDGTSLVLQTNDGGQTWRIQTTIAGEALRALHVRDGHAWTVGDRVRKKPQRLLRLVPPADRQGIDEGDRGQ